MKFHHTHHHNFERDPDAARRHEELVGLLTIIIVNQEIIMATKAEVKADLEEIKAEVTQTRGVANSAIVLLKDLLAKITEAAASATDLDGFRADLALIKTETQATEDELKAAMETNPTPTPTPTPTLV